MRLRGGGASVFSGDAEFLQLGHDIFAVRSRFHAGIDMQNLPVFPNVVSPPGSHLPSVGQEAVSRGGLSFGIAQDRIIQVEGFGEFLVHVGGIAAGGEIGDVEFPDFLAARTERLAFGRSAAGEGLGKPSHHDGLFAFEIGQLISLAVAAGEFEFRRGVAGLEGLGHGVSSNEHAGQGQAPS